MYFHYDQIAEFIVNARTPFLFLIYKLGSIDSEVLLANDISGSNIYLRPNISELSYFDNIQFYFHCYKLDLNFQKSEGHDFNHHMQSWPSVVSILF